MAIGYAQVVFYGAVASVVAGNVVQTESCVLVVGVRIFLSFEEFGEKLLVFVICCIVIFILLNILSVFLF